MCCLFIEQPVNLVRERTLKKLIKAFNFFYVNIKNARNKVVFRKDDIVFLFILSSMK